MRILFHKLNDQRHLLEIQRADGASERIECETRSLLFHDFLHYAVESEAAVGTGFWGRLAVGTTLAEMNDHDLIRGMAVADGIDGDMTPEMAMIERVVGAMSGITKGASPGDLLAGFRRFAASLGTNVPEWLTETMIAAAGERMHQLIGHWRAIRPGQSLQLDWPDPRPLS